MEKRTRKSVFDSLKNYSPMNKEEDFIEVTEWTNGEGYDIQIATSNEIKNISLAYDEVEAINFLIKTLEHSKEEEFK